MAKTVEKYCISAAAVILCLIIGCVTVSAATVYSVPVTVKYGQTEARSMLSMINSFRTGSDAWYWDQSDSQKIYTDLSKLEYDYGLEEIAMQRAAEIAVSFSHTRPDGTSCFTVTSSNGTTSYGENIAAGYSTAAAVFEGWQETGYGYSGQGHRRNMLGSYTHVGIGHAVVNGCHYWVQEFSYGPSNVKSTTANDGNKTVSVPADSGSITEISADVPNTLTIQLGKSVKAPDAAISLWMQNTWRGPIEFTVTPEWKVSGSAISLSGNNITAKSVGKSTLTATVYGKSVSVSVTVECTDHKWGSWSVTKTATCTETGTETRKCSACGKTETRTVAAKGHSMGAYTVTKAATCTADGTETRKCSACTYTETRTIAATGHKMGTYTVTKAATCTEDGTETRKCSACTYTETRAIAATGHKMGEYRVTREPTTDKEGIEERVCSVCGETEQRTIARLAAAVTTTAADQSTPEETKQTESNSEPEQSTAITESSTPAAEESSPSETPEESTDNSDETTDTEIVTVDDTASGGAETDIDNSAVGETSDDIQSYINTEDADTADNGSAVVVGIIAAVVLTIGAIIFVILFSRRKKKSDTDES